MTDEQLTFWLMFIVSLDWMLDRYLIAPKVDRYKRDETPAIYVFAVVGLVFAYLAFVRSGMVRITFR